MNTRQGILVTTFCGSLFMNFASIYWTMWSVLTTSLFMLLVTDFMFFAVRATFPRSLPIRLLAAADARASPHRLRAGQRVLAVSAILAGPEDDCSVLCPLPPSATAPPFARGATIRGAALPCAT